MAVEFVVHEVRLLFLSIGVHFAIMLPIGAHFAGINLAQSFVEDFIRESALSNYGKHLSDHELHLMYGLLISLMFPAGIVGSFGTRYLADRFGRRPALFLTYGITSGLGNLLFGLAPIVDRIELLFIGRLICGFAFGIILTVLMIYVSEFCPHNLRGQTSAIGAAMMGIAAIVMNTLMLPEVLGTQKYWYFVFLGSTVISAISIVLNFTLPETPKFLLIKEHQKEKAIDIIRQFHGEHCDIEDILKGFELEKELADHKIGLLKILDLAHLRKALILSIVFACLRVTLGTHIMATYSVTIFQEQLGLSMNMAKYVTVGMSGLTAICGVLGSVIIEKFNRRSLFLGGVFATVGLIVAVAAFALVVQVKGVCYWASMSGAICIATCSCIFYLLCNAISMYFTTEITPQAAQASVTTVAFILSTFVRCLYYGIFPILQHLINLFSLLVLIALPSFIIGIFLYFKMPETRNLRIHEVLHSCNQLEQEIDKLDESTRKTINEDSGVVC